MSTTTRVRYPHCRHCAWASVYHWTESHTTPCWTAGCEGNAPTDEQPPVDGVAS